MLVEAVGGVLSGSEDKRMVTLHARVAATAGAAVTARISAAIKAHLRTRYGIDHATVEVEGAVSGDEGQG